MDNLPQIAEKMIDAFWPGPLTLVLPKREGVSSYVTAGLDTVAIRMPDHPVAHALLEVSGLPLAAPSANLSGKPSPTTAHHVQEDLIHKIAGIVDGGATGVGLESTVVDCTTEIPVILRPGGVTKEQLEQFVGQVDIDPALISSSQEHKPKSPGMKYTHYAPVAPVFLVEGNVSFLEKTMTAARREGKVVGLLATEETIAEWKLADTVNQETGTIANADLGAVIPVACGTRTILQVSQQVCMTRFEPLIPPRWISFLAKPSRM